MVDSGEDLSLVLEATNDIFRDQAWLEHLQGYPTLELIVAAAREIHRAHTALPKLLLDLIRPYTAILDR